MYCPKCYRKNEDSAEVCSACGYRFKKNNHNEPLAGKEIKYCVHCGSAVRMEAVVCPHCGCSAEALTRSIDKPSVVLDFLALLFPIIGLIMYLVFYQNYPQKAKSVGIAALVGVAVAVFFPLIMVALLTGLF